MSDQEQSWISVADRLPEIGQLIGEHAVTGAQIKSFLSDDVLIYFPGGDCQIECANYDHEAKRWALIGHGFKEPDCDPTHWMPCPEPPNA